MSKKNILLVTADQWRGDCVSALGHPDVKTPNIDALIADGMAFSNHYSVCAPCSPARASLLTGMYLQNHRVVRNGTPLDNRHTNIALELRKLGYTPLLFGYTDTTLDPRVNSESEVIKNGYEGILPGFDEGLYLPANDPEKWLVWLREQGYHFNNVDEAFYAVEDSLHSENDGEAAKQLTFSSDHSQTAFLTQHVMDYTSQAKQGWCVHLSYLRPHPPFYAPPPYNRMYDPDSIVGPTFSSQNDNEHPWLACARGPLGDWPETWMQQSYRTAEFEKESRQFRATYYGLVSKVDHYFGKLIDHLKKTSEYENTLIIVTSDHGELLGDHGLFGKRGYFKEVYHVPLIIKDPMQNIEKRGHIERAVTESVDIMPTILESLDQPIPRQCDGQSLRPFIQGQQPTNWRNEAHWEYDFREVKNSTLENTLDIEMDDCQLNVISTDEYRYVHFTSLPALFFDLRNDPAGQCNVIDKPEYASKVLEISQRLLSWRMHNDERSLTGYSVSREEVYHR